MYDTISLAVLLPTVSIPALGRVAALLSVRLTESLRAVDLHICPTERDTYTFNHHEMPALAHRFSWSFTQLTERATSGLRAIASF